RGILPTLPDETMTTVWNRFQMDPVEYLDRHHGMVNREPRSWWHDGCPLGNGDMGVMAYGPPESSLFLFGKTDLWDARPFGEANYPSAGFAALRKVAQEMDARGFRELRERDRGRTRDDAPTIKPGGMLRLELFPSSKIMGFEQRLSYAHAEVTETWGLAGDRKPSARRYSSMPQPVVMTSFVHAARNVMAIHVRTGDHPFHEPVCLSLWRGEDPDMVAPEAKVEKSVGWIRQELPGGKPVVLMLGSDSEAFDFFEMGGRVFAKGRVPTETLTFYITLETGAEALTKARENIADARAAGFETLRETHRAWWHRYWERSYLATPWPSVEAKWYQALYLHACVQRPGCMSPGLQGNWIKENYPAWNGDFHNNINIQIVNWSYFTANRLELGEPFYRLYHGVLPRVTEDTKAYFNMRGARYPISMGPDGAETCSGQFLSAWFGSSGWLAPHFWWHYQYTGDLEFLRLYAYPMIKAAAQFYEDYLQEGPDGRLIAHPSVMMELMAACVEGFGTNSIWDWPVVIRTFQMAGEAAAALATDAEDRRRWAEILPRLSPLPATAEGVWKEFSDKPLLHMHQWEFAKFMAIFPMGLVGEDFGPEEWREQARRTLADHFAYWREHGDTPDACYRTIAGFGMVGPALARMGMGKESLEYAEMACKDADSFGPAGFVCNRSTHCVQVDTPLMMSMFLNEMLLQSYDGVIRVFPAAPAGDGALCFHSLRAQGGFLVSSERRQNRVPYVVIRSLLGNEVRIRNPFTGEKDRAVQVKIYRLEEGLDFRKQHQIPAMLDRLYFPGDIISFVTEKGNLYLVSKEIPWYVNVPQLTVE
ncbi:MAG: glycoside hydrolase N-terminal domain-containing protein, partial [Kiritimatiellae bacterium]|nr:glycoside hydrolase N-terminal domain-containing protein [Kiritimatiellia bacterium]